VTTPGVRPEVDGRDEDTHCTEWTAVARHGGSPQLLHPTDPLSPLDSRGNVYYAGLGFNRTTPGSTVAVNKGTFDQHGYLTWSAPTFINQTTSPSTLNDKEWIAVDSHAASPFRDRVYVTWTRFVFNAHTGAYVQSPIAFAYSRDGGATWSKPVAVSQLAEILPTIYSLACNIINL